MTPTAPPPRADGARLEWAARQLETLVLKQLVHASKAFTGGTGPGNAIRAELFADALADALERGGGIGLARRLAETLQPGDGGLTRQGSVEPGATAGGAPRASTGVRPHPVGQALKRYAPRADDVVDIGS